MCVRNVSSQNNINLEYVNVERCAVLAVNAARSGLGGGKTKDALFIFNALCVAGRNMDINILMSLSDMLTSFSPSFPQSTAPETAPLWCGALKRRHEKPWFDDGGQAVMRD